MRVKKEVEIDVDEDAIRDYAKNVLHMTSVADRVPEDEIKRIAIDELGLIDPKDEDALDQIKEDNDWKTEDDLLDDWADMVGESEIEDYARDYLEMKTEEEFEDEFENILGCEVLTDWAINNFSDIWDSLQDGDKDEYTRDWLQGEWTDIIDEDEIVKYAQEDLDMISIDDVYDYVRENPEEDDEEDKKAN